MRFAVLIAVAAQAIGAVSVPDAEIRRQTAGIEKIAAQESPRMAIATLLQAAAARLAPLAQDPEAVTPVVEGMRTEKVDPPADSASALTRFKLAELGAALETRYDFSLASLAGPKRTLQSARGKVVVLNFWAVWCVPCREEMPILAAARGPKVEVMAVTEDPLERLQAFADKQPLNITMLMDPAGKVSEHYRVMELPHTVILDARGAQVKQFREPVTERTLREAIEAAARLR